MTPEDLDQWEREARTGTEYLTGRELSVSQKRIVLLCAEVKKLKFITDHQAGLLIRLLGEIKQRDKLIGQKDETLKQLLHYANGKDEK